MNWYKQYKIAMKLASLQGEWWIVDGSADFSDGDVGDYNHEARAIEHAQTLVKDAMEKDPVMADLANNIFGTQGDYETYDPIASREYMANWIDYALQEGYITDEESDNIYETIVTRTGISMDVLDLALGNTDDGRDFAIKNWGWIRVAGNNIEMNTLTSSDTKNLAEGLWDAYQEEAEEANYEIYVYSNKNRYTEVPFSAIDEGPMSIRPYLASLEPYKVL